jgi:hypothetical protein
MHTLEAGTSSLVSQTDHTSENIYVINGNALLQSLVRLPEMFGQLALTVFNSLSRAKIVHFVTDSYYGDSIKEFERSRRGSSACTSTNWWSNDKDATKFQQVHVERRQQEAGNIVHV